MGATTAIGWADASWIPVTGCTRVSAGCDNCYAYTLHDARHVAWKRGRYETAAAQYHRPFSTVQLLPERLVQPLHWRAPKRIFVSSMGDLFHDEVPDKYIAKVWAIMDLARKHTFQVLTKRPERAWKLLTDEDFQFHVGWFQSQAIREFGLPEPEMIGPMPLGNVWLGTSVENQEQADRRIPWLMETPAALRFLSCEPLLGPVDIGRLQSGWKGVHGEHWYAPREVYPLIATMAIPDCDIDSGGIGWVIVGGESGPRHRPMEIDWLAAIVRACRQHRVPVYTKQDAGRWAGRQGRIPPELWCHDFPEPSPEPAPTPVTARVRVGGYPT